LSVWVGKIDPNFDNRRRRKTFPPPPPKILTKEGKTNREKEENKKNPITSAQGKNKPRKGRKKKTP
jgi:hypothetical protein